MIAINLWKVFKNCLGFFFPSRMGIVYISFDTDLGHVEVASVDARHFYYRNRTCSGHQGWKIKPKGNAFTQCLNVLIKHASKIVMLAMHP